MRRRVTQRLLRDWQLLRDETVRGADFQGALHQVRTRRSSGIVRITITTAGAWRAARWGCDWRVDEDGTIRQRERFHGRKARPTTAWRGGTAQGRYAARRRGD